MSAAPHLRADGLCRQAGGRSIVAGLSLSVAPGEVLGLLGPNGAGKTTTFNMMAGALRPSAGRVLLGARDISRLPMYRRARLGLVYLPQEACVFRGLSVADNVRAVVETVVRTRSARRERVAALLEELGLSARAAQRADSLSGGERRRLEIARALVLEPKFLLLDEPYTGIDPLAVADLQALIAKLAARGIGIVLTEHKVREALAVCSKVLVMAGGTVVREGTPAEITADPQVRRSYLGENFELA